MQSAATPEIFIYEGYSPEGLWDESPPVGSAVNNPVQSLKTKSSRSWSSLQTLFTGLGCRNDQNLKIPHSSPPDSWAVGPMFHDGD